MQPPESSDPNAADPNAADPNAADLSAQLTDPGSEGAEPVEPDVDTLQTEILALRARNAELAEEVGSRGSAWITARHIARSTAVVLMVVLGALCLTVSPVAIWGRNLVLNTDRYVETLTPLASDPGLQDAVIRAVDRQVESHIDIPAALEGQVPDRLASLIGPPLQSAVTGLVNTVVTNFVRSDAFETLWVEINRRAHEQINNILTGSGDDDKAVKIDSSGKVILDLAPIVANVKSRLVAAGIGVAQNIPTVGATLEIAEVKGVVKAQKAVRALDTIANWLPWIGLAFLAGAIATARRHRRALIASMLAVAGGMVVVALGLLIARKYYLDNVPPRALDRDTAQRLFDTLVRFLRDGLRIVLGVALLIALIAWLFGPARPAQAIRHWLKTVPRAAVAGIAGGPVGAFVSAYATALSIGAVSLGLLIIALWDNPGTAVFITLLVLVVIVVGLIQWQRLATERHRGGPAPGVGASA